MLWSGTADSAIDLNSLLPFTSKGSTAYTIDAQGNIWGIANDRKETSTPWNGPPCPNRPVASSPPGHWGVWRSSVGLSHSFGLC